MTRQALHTALTSLAYALDPWFGHLGLTAPADPTNPFGPTIRLAGPLFHETPAQGHARRAAAVTAFKTGLAAATDPDSRRVAAQIEDAERLSETLTRHGYPTGPRYAAVVADALARLAADAESIPADAPRRRCTVCGRVRAVVEVDATASAYAGPDEIGWTATHLSCGHTLTTAPVVIGRSPGGEAAAEATAQARTADRLARTGAHAEAYGDL